MPDLAYSQPAPPPPLQAAKRPRHLALLAAAVLLSAALLLLVVPQLRSTQQPRPQQAAGRVQLATTAESGDDDGGRDNGGSSGSGQQALLAAPTGPPVPAVPLPPDFRFIKVVAIIAFDRFEYFRQVIDHLLRAWGSDAYIVTITIDGAPKKESAFDRAGWQSVVDYSNELAWLAVNGHGFKEVLVNVSHTNLGVWPNKKRAVAGAMALSDFVVVLEDDIVVSADALRWFEWHVTSGLIFRRPDLALSTCWSSSFPYDDGAAVEGRDLLAAAELGLLDKFWMDGWAQPWGWATWRRTWDAVGDRWTGQDRDLGLAVKARGWLESMPAVARCNNIGSVGAHKRGAVAGHIHQRTLTSDAFLSSLHRCAYTQLLLPPAATVDAAAANATATGSQPKSKSKTPAHPRDEVDKHVRRGIFRDRRFQGKSLPELQGRMREFVAGHHSPGQWQSTC